MRHLLLLFVLLTLMTACSPAAEDLSPSSPTTPPQEPAATLPPNPTPEPANPQGEPTAEPTSAPADQPDPEPELSGLSLHQATFLMAPRHFQVSLDGWPAELAADLLVRVAGEDYQCDLLFPEKYPERAYCWGLAPAGRGEVLIEIIYVPTGKTLREIPFTVPSSSSGG